MANDCYPFSLVRVVQTYKALECAVQWQLDSSFRDITPLDFELQVSETPDFSSLLYTIPVGDNFYAVDSQKKRQGICQNFYYRVKLTTGSGKTFYSAVVVHWASKLKRNLKMTASEITRREFVRYRYTGQVGWLLKRRNYGLMNATLLDPISGVPLSDQNADFGTGFVGGYYQPIKVSYSREGVENTTQLSTEGFGTNSQESQRHRYVGFPLLDPYDILVTDSNQRYRYSKVAPTFMPGTDLILLQLCDAQMLPLTDPIYKIEIPTS